MSVVKASNLERKRWRIRSRTALADHIEQRIGVRIDPSEVRLITSEKDAYGWQRLPEAEPLFAKHLSDLSVGAYRKICEGVGRTFEAVVSPHHNGEEVRSIRKTPGNGTFTSRINSLTAEIDRLESELRGCNESLQSERDAREVESELVNTRKDYDNQRVKLDEAISISVQLELVNSRITFRQRRIIGSPSILRESQAPALI